MDTEVNVIGMELKNVKDRLKDAMETENPPGTNYYGTEVDEVEVEAARERMERAIGADEEVGRDSNTSTAPVTRRQAT
jgi:hypothetical protein